MIRTLAATLALAAFCAPASATDAPEAPFNAYYEDVLARADAGLWRADAAGAELALSGNRAATALDEDDPLLAAAAEFARASAAASARLRANHGPADLACIFAGMAQDAEARMGDIASAPTTLVRAREVAGLRALFNDAVILTPGGDENGAAPDGTAPQFNCPLARPDRGQAPQDYLR